MSEIKTSDYKCGTNTRNHVVSLRFDLSLEFAFSFILALQ